jgi:hypothetical protein
MPGGDRTGPMGRGPMTGRAAGLCAGAPVPGYESSAQGGRGFGRGGRGFGRRNRRRAPGRFDWQRPPQSPLAPQETADADEVRLLRQQVQSLREELNQLKEERHE